MTRTTSVKVNLKKYSPEAVRYAAYAVSDEAFVMVRGGLGGRAAVDLTPRGGRPGRGLKARFLSELDDEKLRETASCDNRELREFLVRKALSPETKPAAKADSGLTPEQEKELADLITQVEDEIKEEERSGRRKDPLGITKTWEEKYGGKTNGKKRRQ
ncbi:MAG: hypothetical protein WCK76_13075 [Elusimicrobiota bacterium]